MADPDISVLQRNSGWADRFQGATTNLAQRKRYAQDQEAYAEDLLRQQQASLLDEAKTNKTAQDFYFRQQDMLRQRTNDQAKRAMDQHKVDFDNQINPLRIQAEQAKLRTQQALETSRLNKEKRDSEQALKVTQDTDAFETGINDLYSQKIMPGSEGFAQRVVELSAAHPFVPSALRKDIFTQAKIQKSPDELMAESAQLKDTHDMKLTGGPNGWAITMSPKASKAGDVDTYEKLNKDMAAAKLAHGVTDRKGAQVMIGYSTTAVPLPKDLQEAFRQRRLSLEAANAAPKTTPQPSAAIAPQAASEPVAPALKAMDDDVLKSARAAISAGKDAKAVANRLKENGYDPSGL